MGIDPVQRTLCRQNMKLLYSVEIVCTKNSLLITLPATVTTQLTQYDSLMCLSQLC